VGHAKSICLNFGLARDYGGVCHMRFDDTNPEKEDQEYVNGILDAVQWLGYGWEANGTSHLYHASDYFDFMYRAAEYLVEAGLAYVDEQSPEDMRANRGAVHEVEVVACVIQMTGAVRLPAIAQPLHRVQDAVDVLLVFLLRVGVVEAHVAHAAVVARQPEVQADALGVAHMQVTIWFWWEACADLRGVGLALAVLLCVCRLAGPMSLGVSALFQVAFDHLAQEIAGF